MTREEVREEMLDARIAQEIRNWQAAPHRKRGSSFRPWRIDELGFYALTVRTSFAAAHRLREYDGNCERLHGHNWQVEVTVESPTLDERGIALDFRVLKTSLHDLLTRFDHRYPERRPAVRRNEPVVGESRAPLVRGNGKIGPGAGARVPRHRVGIRRCRADYYRRD